MTTRKNWTGAALVLLVAASGCGEARLARVKGKLTHNGKPVPSTQVKFLPDDGGRPSNGVTNDQGEFELKYTRNEYGATRGGHVVVLKYEVSADEELKKVPTKLTPEMKALLEKYNAPKKSKLHYDISKDGQFVEIELD